MHAIRRHLCLILVILVGVKSALIVWQAFLSQAYRLGQLMGLGPAIHQPGCPDPFCDYSIFWVAGRLSAQDGAAAVYEPARFFAGATQILPHEIHNLPFLYPPPMLPLTFLMSLPPLSVGYYGFEILSLAAAVFLLRRAGISSFCIAAGLLSPAALWCLYLGQFGTLCGTILVAGLIHLEMNPRAGGALLALLCVKPQYGLLAPVLLLARSNLRAWTAAATVLTILFALSVLCFGWASWVAFLGPDRDAMHAWLQRPFGLSDQMQGTSVFWMARSFGAALPIAYSFQLMVSAMTVLCTWRLWRQDGIARDHRVAITACLCLLASPYSYTGDMVAYSIACAMLIRRTPAVTDVLLALLWLAPGYCAHFAMKFGFLPTPLCITAVALIGWQRARREAIPASPALTGRRSAPVLSLSPTPSHRFR